VKVDLDFRKQWDTLVITLDVVDKDVESGTEVVHWVMHYPVSISSLSTVISVIIHRACYDVIKYLH